MEKITKNLNKPIQQALVLVILMGLILAFGLSKFAPWVADGDFLGYWTSAHLLASGGNPYDVNEIANLQAAQRPELTSNQGTYVITSWNPPHLTLIMLPLGLLPYKLAVAVWIFVNIICVGFSIVYCWAKFTTPFDERGFLVIFIISLTFFPTILSITIGQITGLILLFLILFLHSLENKHDVLAGFALVMTMVKPHLFYFVYLLIVIWAIRWRRWGIFIGMIATGIISMVLMWVILPGWLGDYIKLLNQLPYEEVPTGTLGYFMKFTFSTGIFYYASILLLPLIPTFIHIAEKDGWIKVINIALPLSIPLAIYGFGVDQILVLPALAQIFAWIRTREFKGWMATLIMAGYFLSQALLYYDLIDKTIYLWDFWLAWFILGLYLIVQALRNKSTTLVLSNTHS